MGNFFSNQDSVIEITKPQRPVSDNITNQQALLASIQFDPWFPSESESQHWYSNGLIWPHLNVYPSYEATLRHYGQVGEGDFEYFTQIKVDSENERVSSRIYDDADLFKLLQIQNLDYRAPHPLFQEIMVRPAEGSGHDQYEYKCKFDRYLRPKESLTFKDQLKSAWNPPTQGGQSLFMGLMCLESDRKSYFAFKGKDQLQGVQWISYVDILTREIVQTSTLDGSLNIEPISEWKPRSDFSDSEFQHHSCEGVKQILYRGPLNPTINMGITF